MQTFHHNPNIIMSKCLVITNFTTHNWASHVFETLIITIFSAFHSWCFLSNMFLKLAHISQLDQKYFTFLPCRLQLMPMDHWPFSQISNLIFDIRQIGGCNVLNCYICIKIIFKCQHNIITQGLNIPSHIFSWFSKFLIN